MNKNPEVFLGRQAILDRSGNLFAYELLFRNGQVDSSNVTDDVHATSSVISHTFCRIGVEKVLGKHLGFINIDAEVLHGDLLDYLPSRQIVLELLETVVVTPQVVARCHELKARGFKLALDDFVFSPDFLTILPLADFIKIDLLAHALDDLPQIITHLRQWPAQLLAEKVDTSELADYCIALGFDLFQGYYYERPSLISSRLHPAPSTSSSG